MERTYRQLVAVFKKLGAHNPESWAKSEIEEGIPQLARFLFLRQAWEKAVIREDDQSWTGIRAQALGSNPDQPEFPERPCGGFGAALNRIMNKGVNPTDLIEVIRVMQYESLFGLCYLLGDPGDVEPEVSDVRWGLFQVDENGQPICPMDSLHESVLSLDPTGREMRPKKR